MFCTNFQQSVFISKQTGNFWPFLTPFDPWGAPKRVKIQVVLKINTIIVFLMLHMCSVQIFSNKSWFLSERAIFDLFRHPFDPWGAPKRVKIWVMLKSNTIIVFLMLNMGSVQIFSNKSSFLSKRAIFDPFRPLVDPRVPQNGSKFEIC